MIATKLARLDGNGNAAHRVHINVAAMIRLRDRVELDDRVHALAESRSASA